jgi:hypothetical protein
MSDMGHNDPGGRARRVGIALAALLLLALLPGTGYARDGPPGPDGLPLAQPRHPWILVPGIPRVDTLAYAWDEVFPAACRQFHRDSWPLFAVDRVPQRGRIVTRWKQLHHPLIWLFMGKVMARCTATVSPLGGNRTRVSFQGDIASHRDLHRNPMLGAAKRAYAKAARNWESEVIKDMNARRRGARKP